MNKQEAPKVKAPARPDPGVLQLNTTDHDGLSKDMTQSQLLVAVIGKAVMAAQVTKAYANVGEDMQIGDLMIDMKKAGDETVNGDLGRIERMLTHQVMTLDTLFNNLALKASRSELVKNYETYLRLAFKAQSQARATAETLAIMKNPQPYIKQANIAHGHQQVNNGSKPAQYAMAHAGVGENINFSQSKLLEQSDGNTLDSRTTDTPVRANSVVGAMETVHGA